PKPTDPLARVLRWARWPVLVIWVVAIVLLEPFASSLSSKVNDTPQANLPDNASSTRVAEIQDAANKGMPKNDDATVVFVRDGGLTAADVGAIAAAHTAMANLVGTVHNLGAPGSPSKSDDGD